MFTDNLSLTMKRAALRLIGPAAREQHKQEVIKACGTIQEFLEELRGPDASDGGRLAIRLDAEAISNRLETMRHEIGEWSQNNFGNQVSKRNGRTLGDLAPLLGVAEELGEFTQAFHSLDSNTDQAAYEAECDDAFADMLIYLCDFATRTGVRFTITKDELDASVYQKYLDHNLETNGHTPSLPSNAIDGLAILVGKLIHINLKSHQGIRGMNDPGTYHDANRKAIHAIYLALERYDGYKLLAKAEAVWAKVKQRNWKKNPTDAHTVADAAGVSPS